MTTATLAILGTPNATAHKLAAMFTENTGRSMLDSGGAYGRAWERNQGLTVGDFLARPEVTVDADGEITVDMFNFLNERLTYDARLDGAWQAFDAEHPELSWGESLSEWLDSIDVPAEGDGDFYSDARWDFNTYNFDGCLLNGTFQGVKFGLDGAEYIALQIHGGCDVRGGYTKPVIFTGDMESVILDTTSAYMRCPESDCDFYASYSHGIYDPYLPDSKGTSDMLIEVTVPTVMPEEWHFGNGCPLHKVPLI